MYKIILCNTQSATTIFLKNKNELLAEIRANYPIYNDIYFNKLKITEKSRFEDIKKAVTWSENCNCIIEKIKKNK